jgi:hypothetical protein
MWVLPLIAAAASLPRPAAAATISTVDAAAASLAELDDAIARLQRARAAAYPAAPAPPLPVCGYEKPIMDACVDPCPACLAVGAVESIRRRSV